MDVLKSDLTKLTPEEKDQVLMLFQSQYKSLLKDYEYHKKKFRELANELAEYKQVKFDIGYQNTVLKNLMFGPKSEKVKLRFENEESQAQLFETGDEKKTRVSQKRANKQKLDLFITEHTFDRNPICNCCQAEMAPIKGQYEVSNEITVIERIYVKMEHRRQKYSCNKCNGSIVTAPGPTKLSKGSTYSPDFAIQVAVDKYADHLPLDRQAAIMERSGLEVKPVTLWNQLERLANVLVPVYKRLHETVLKTPVIHSDETHWKLLRDGGKTWWVWGLRSKRAAYYKILESRSGKVPIKLLDGYKGILMVDGYGGYNQVALNEDIKRVFCWAHARRKFYNLKKEYPDDGTPIFQKIEELYFVEKDIENEEDRLGVRRTKSAAIINQLRDMLFDLLGRSLKKSPQAQACNYILKGWDGFRAFLYDPKIPLDNNLAENSLRNPVIGRKNHLGSKSTVGAHVTSIFYTIVESCKVNGIDPQAYLKNIVPKLIEGDEILLPHEWSRS